MTSRQVTRVAQAPAEIDRMLALRDPREVLQLVAILAVARLNPIVSAAAENAACTLTVGGADWREWLLRSRMYWKRVSLIRRDAQDQGVAELQRVLVLATL